MAIHRYDWTFCSLYYLLVADFAIAYLFIQSTWSVEIQNSVQMQYNVQMTKITYSCFVVTILSMSVFSQRCCVSETLAIVMMLTLISLSYKC